MMRSNQIRTLHTIRALRTKNSTFEHGKLFYTKSKFYSISNGKNGKLFTIINGIIKIWFMNYLFTMGSRVQTQTHTGGGMERPKRQNSTGRGTFT